MVYGASERKNTGSISSCEAYTVSGKEGEGLEKKTKTFYTSWIAWKIQANKEEIEEENLFPF